MTKNDKKLIEELNDSFKSLYDCGFKVESVNLPLKKLKLLRLMKFKNINCKGEEEYIDVSLSTGKEISYIVSMRKK